MDEGLSTTGRRVVGYALKWGEPANINNCNGSFVEAFKRGAFAKSIASTAVNLCLEHDKDAVIASQSDGRLTLVEDHIGLRIDAMIAENDDGDEAITAVRQRSRVGLSVSFGSPVCEWQDVNGTRTRVVTGCDLEEISICREPAYRSSEIVAGAMRIDSFLKTIDPSAERERRLADAERKVAQWRGGNRQGNDKAAISDTNKFIREDNEFWLMFG